MTKTPDPMLQCPDYRILASVQGSLGGPAVTMGTRGRCRFCGETNLRAFRKIAHTMPEAFGNKWVTSLDECDVCNAKFGAFDDALVKSMGAILTVGGVRGKGNKVRQTGRSRGPTSIRHDIVDGRRSISMRADGMPLEDHVGHDPATGELVFRISGGAERFVPARAYKALVKMGVELLPEDELLHFSKVIAWLGTSDDDLLPHMIVGLSLASIGNAPPLLATVLLRRTSDCQDLPWTLVIITIGSVCLQTVLKADTQDGQWPSNLRTRPRIAWSNVILSPDHEPVKLVYGDPAHLDWGQATLEPPVIETVVTRIHTPTQRASMSVILRESALAQPLT